MKQTVEEAAYDYATNKTSFRKDVLKEVDTDTYVSRHADSMEDFQCGAEWQSKQSPWISVKERLPENNTVVLTRGAYGFLICQLSSLGEWETGANVNKERLGITHWIPIPSFDDILESNRDVLERIE
jgi:hypothetical protein